MSVLIDTSAFICVLDARDPRHTEARRTWDALIDSDETLVTTNCIVLETCAVLQRNCGMDAARIFLVELLPAVSIEWVDTTIHHAATSAFLTAMRRTLSLVDCISFDAMRQKGIATVFAFDRPFKEQGFTVMP